MEFLILGLLGMALATGKQAKTQKQPQKAIKKQIIDRGDCWNCLYRGLEYLSDDKTRAVFKNLMSYVADFNRIFDKNMQIFETTRAPQRQLRLIKSGNSQANINFAPHVQGRAVDFAELKNGVWVWDNRDLKALNDFLYKNFPQWELLRTGRDFKHFVDWPHYEIKRSIWEKWQ